VTPLQVMQQFVACINRQDVDGLAALMSEDHRFIDSLGQLVTGRESMRQGWTYYFAMVPDYELVPESWMSDGDLAVMLGTARGTYSPDGVKSPERKWSCPAVCRAQVNGALVAEWRVYADNEPLRQLMKAQSSA
jgi:ketosteroid isomerase-like protein